MSGRGFQRALSTFKSGSKNNEKEAGRRMSDFGKRVMMALYFYPRGGSAQVVRYLGGRLRKSLRAQLYSGSPGQAGAATHAGIFYAGMKPIPLGYTAAELEWRKGGDPLRAEPPMHGSFEDRAGVADKFLARLSPGLAGRQVSAWRRLFRWKIRNLTSSSASSDPHASRRF